MSTSNPENNKVKKRVMRGIVVSSKLDKGIVVRIDYRIKHPVVKKFVTRSKNIMAHDEKNEAKEGDFVTIEVCRPISAKKRFKLLEVTKKGLETVKSTGAGV